ncbi:hypothetical protein BGX30_012416, partial [Mortierella sp. GBA39]
KIEEIVWRPNKLEFATADIGESTRVWKVVEESGRVRVQLVWGTGGSGLVASGSLLDDAIGISTFNRNLLEQPVVDNRYLSSLGHRYLSSLDDRYLSSLDHGYLSSSEDSYLSSSDDKYLSSSEDRHLSSSEDRHLSSLDDRYCNSDRYLSSSDDESLRRWQVEDDVEKLQCLQSDYEGDSSFSSTSSRGRSPLQAV